MKTGFTRTLPIALLAAGLPLLTGCGDKDESEFNTPGVGTGGGSDGDDDDGGDDSPEYPDEVGFDLDGIWQSLEPDVEGQFGVPPAFGCGTTSSGLYEVEGSVVLDVEERPYRGARVYYPSEPVDGDTFTIAAPTAFDALGYPSALDEGTAAVVIIRGTGPETLSWTADGSSGTLEVVALNGATRPRHRWLDAGLLSDDDGTEALSEGGHLKCD